MPDIPAPLLRHWTMLQEQIILPLLAAPPDHRPPRVWALDDIGDAVAVAVAYRHAQGGGSLRAYASGPHDGYTSITFSLSDIRAVPRPARMAAFRRSAQGWVPDPGIAQQVILSSPRTPVDLVTLRAAEPNHRILARASSMLCPGGHLALVEGAHGPLPPGSQLEPLDDKGIVYKKCGRPEPSAATSADDDEEGQTLAQRQVECALVGSHLNLARSLARRFSGHGESRDDLNQVALLGLVLAARRFDPERNASFSTYATATIMGELKRHFRDKSWMMRVPRSVQETYLAVKDARAILYQELSSSPTIQQIADRLRISEEAVLEAMEAGDNFWPQSLDVGVDENNGCRDVPVSDRSFDLMLERHQLQEALPRLPAREQLLLKRLYLDGWTQRQAAEEIGVSQMQVSRLLHGAQRKLRAWTRV